MIRILRNSKQISEFIGSLDARLPSENGEVVERVRSIVSAVRSQGRRGVLELRQSIEGVSSEAQLVYRREELMPLAEKCPAAVRSVLRRSIDRVRAYHQIQRDGTRWMEIGSSRFASRVQPLDSVALYVPGGKAFYPSSVVMSAVPAQVAGVRRMAVFTPARSLQDPVFAATVCELGIDDVFAVGGAQAVALAAFGDEQTQRFDKIVGPGNIYVATAKQLLAGRIGIDGFAGPSEILILSDGSTPARWIALDLLAQAEHDEDASAILVTTSEREAAEVAELLSKMTDGVCGDRAEIARRSLEQWGAICVVRSRDELVEAANALNAEHLHVQTACALDIETGQPFWLNAIRGAGAIFLGRWSAESFGDYLAGPSHVLPTAGTARFASPLGVYDFVRRSSVLAMSAEDSRALAEETGVFADAEQLWAHAAAARARLDSEVRQ
ncbi:MAG: histidinol dehydrogenase [Proteobacteria bacterium]|nr:histidinol dehydrogenase [Pseudomonadota bacterium]